MFSQEAEDFYRQGKLAERAGEYEKAVSYYKKAERLGHDLLEPYDRLTQEEIFELNQIEKEFILACGIQGLSKEEEKEDHPYLTESEVEELKKHPHALDYKFTEEDKEFLDKNGYLVVKGVIPVDQCKKMVTECFEKMETLYNLKKDDCSTWLSALGMGFSDVWHGEAYYQIRQNPIIYSIFAQLLREPHLTVSLDRVSIKPPAYVDIETGDKERPTKRLTFPMDKLQIHTDMNYWGLKESMYQGGVSLVDTLPGNGGFCCVPGMHKLDKIREYREKYERGVFHDNKKVDPPGGDYSLFLDTEICERFVEVPMFTGDFVIWNSRLPHANLANQSHNWRIQCFVRHLPASTHQGYTKMVNKSVETGLKPSFYSTGGGVDPSFRDLETKNYKLPELTWLGKRLMGFESWSS